MDDIMIISLVTVIFGTGIIFFLSSATLFKKHKLSDAIKAFAGGNYLSARQMLEKLILGEPRNSLAYWYSARASFELGDVNRALAELKQIIQIHNYSHHEKEPEELGDFSEVGVHRYLRDLFTRARMDNNVFAENQVLMKLEPENPEYPFSIAKMLIKKGEFSDRTLSFLATTNQIAPNNPVTEQLISFVFLRQQKFDKAVHWAQKALQTNPGLSDALYVLGEADFAQKRFDSARSHLEKARFSELYGKSALFSLSRLLVSQGKLSEALEYAQKADQAPVSSMETSELEWDSKYVHALVLERIGKGKSAHDLYKTIFSHKPDYRDVAEKMKMVQADKADDLIKDLKTARNDLFQSMGESIVNQLGLSLQKIEFTEDSNLNAIARSKDTASDLYAIFIRRNIDLIQADQLEKLVRFQHSINAKHAIYITAGDFVSEARQAAERNSIRLIPGSTLESILNKSGSRS